MAVRNFYNCGVLRYHVERLASTGLIGLGYTNAPASIAPVGDKSRLSAPTHMRFPSSTAEMAPLSFSINPPASPPKAKSSCTPGPKIRFQKAGRSLPREIRPRILKRP